MLNFHTRLMAIALTVASIGACTPARRSAAPEPPAARPGLDLSNMDRSVSPGEDFFRYVNGRWLDSTEIPADRERWGSFDELRKTTDAQTLAVLRRAIDSGAYAPDSDPGKAATYFALALDTVGRRRAGVTPIASELAEIRAIESYADVVAYERKVLPEGRQSLFGFGVGTNPKNSNAKLVSLSGGALGLPDRDYYLDADTASAQRRLRYRAHVARMLRFVGYDSAASEVAARRVLALETEIAAAKLDKVARRDPYKRYNPRTPAQLADVVPAVDWESYFRQHGLDVPDSVNVPEVAYLDLLGQLLTARPERRLVKNDPAREAEDPLGLDHLRDYLAWQLVDRSAPYLTPEMERANWAFYSADLRGAKQDRPRDERALAAVNRVLGEAVGQLYVDAYFPPEAKRVAEELVANLRRAYAARIAALDWMSAETKARALAKLNTFRVKIGYPDEWRDYTDLAIVPAAAGGHYLDATTAAQVWGFEEDIAEANLPVDKDEWFMSPQTVNAYYSSSFNEIVFPAAILQPPFYDYRADAAVNYGGIGAVIGHEISHGFDDKGSQYDQDGNLASWWTAADRERFDARTQRLAEQYDAYEPLPGVRVNGAFTLGENIGDLGGVASAYDALQLHLAEHGRPGPIDGLTAEQRFFISWATIWRGKYRDRALENQVKTDPHSPSQYRASGPLLNLQAFYDAFGIEPGDTGYVAPEDRVVIW